MAAVWLMFGGYAAVCGACVDVHTASVWWRIAAIDRRTGHRVAVDGRDAEIASGLSGLAAHGDATKLPRSIMVRH
jgi:hypothetical protein